MELPWKFKLSEIGNVFKEAIFGENKDLGDVLGVGGDLLDLIPEFFKSVGDFTEEAFDELFPDILLGGLTNSHTLNAIEEVLNSVFTHDNTVNLAKRLSHTFIEPIVSILEKEGGGDEIDGKHFAETFHGVTMLLTLPRIILSTLKGTEIGRIIGPLDEALTSVYWNLGLGFLGWQTLSPLLGSGLQPGLERYYNRLYRPRRLNEGELAYLYSIDKISLEYALDNMAWLGWPDNLRDIFFEEQFHALNDSEIFDLYQAGKIDRDTARLEMAKQGTNPKYLDDLLNLKMQGSLGNPRNTSVSRIRKAYQDKLISITEFKRWMKQLNYSDESIKLEIQLIDLETELEQRDLSLSQVKAGYKQSIINDDEVFFYLTEHDYTPEDANTILATWKSEQAPKILKLNAGTVISAFKAGVLNETQVIRRLFDIGYGADAATIMINTAIAQQAETIPVISISYLVQAAQLGAISLTDLEVRLRGRGVPLEDIGVYKGIASFKEFGQLTPVDIERAWKAGVINDNMALDFMNQLGVTGTTAQLRLGTWRSERASYDVDLTPASLTIMYKQGLISTAEFQMRLLDYGFDEREAQLLVQSAQRPYPRDLNADEIRELFLSKVVERAKALNLLVSIGYDNAEANLLISSWEQIKSDTRPQPSVSQYVRAFKDGLLNQQEFTANLLELGYSPNAVNFYLNSATQINTDSTKELTKADILKAYEDGIMPYFEALERLLKQGYVAGDAEILLELRQPDITKTDTYTMLINGYITADEAFDIWMKAGYTPDEIINGLEKLLGD